MTHSSHTKPISCSLRRTAQGPDRTARHRCKNRRKPGAIPEFREAPLSESDHAMTQTLQPAASQSITLSDEARQYARASKAPRTVTAYRAAWQDFSEYCADHRVPALPASPAVVIEYLTELAKELKVSTLQVRLAAIAEAHRMAHLPDPTIDADVKTVMAGIRRRLGTAPRKKAPVTRDELKKMIAQLPSDLISVRDKALLLVGWAGAFRRSELVALDMADVRITDKIAITVRRSKTDQEGKGLVKIIPMLDDAQICPTRALKAWLAQSQIQSGPLFRGVDRHGHVHGRLSDKSVALIVKKSARRAGLSAFDFAGHSLRSGFITEAANAGVESRDIMAQTGHKSEVVMRGYIQDAGLGAAGAVRAAFGETKLP